MQDFSRNLKYSDGRSNAAKVACFGTLRYQSVFLFRLSQKLGRRIPLLGFLIKQINQAVTGADIAWQAEIGDGMILFHPNGVVIGPHSRIGKDVTIQQGVTIGGSGDSSITEVVKIGDSVSFGSGCKIIGNLSVGDKARIGANAVVLGDVPADTTAVGVPARLIPRAF